MAFLAVYGHVNVDYVLVMDALPERESTTPVKRTLIRLGGTAGNIARAAQSLGVPTSLAGFVGDDFPADFRSSLASSGIDVSDLRHLPGSTPKVWMLSVPDGPQSAIIDQGVMGDDVTRPELDMAWLHADWVHLTTGNPEEWINVARQAHEAKKSVSVDPAQELAYRFDSSTLERFLNHSTLFWCNQVELRRALDLFGYGDAVQLLDHTQAVIVTRGRDGARVVLESEVVDVPACPVRSQHPVETTGAGDVFRGGVYAAIEQGITDWSHRLRYGAAATSLYLEAGGTRFPTQDALTSRLDEWSM